MPLCLHGLAKRVEAVLRLEMSGAFFGFGVWSLGFIGFRGLGVRGLGFRV